MCVTVNRAHGYVTLGCSCRNHNPLHTASSLSFNRIIYDIIKLREVITVQLDVPSCDKFMYGYKKESVLVSS